MGGGVVVGHGLHQTQITGESIFDEILAVAGDSRSLDVHPAAAEPVDLLQLLQNNGHRIALVGVIVGVEQLSLGADEGHLGGGGSGVNPQPGIPRIGEDIGLGGVRGVVPGNKGVVFRLAAEERGHGIHQCGVVHALLQLFEKAVKVMLLVVRGTQSRADGGEAVAVLRENGMVLVQLQRLHKALPQAGEEVERTAQEDNLPLQLPPLGEAGHSLIHHGLKNRGRHILLAPALVQDRLDIALGKNATAGGDGVYFFVLQGEFIQFGDGHIHQGGHLIDEGAGSAGTGAVHPLLQGAAEENNLGVLAAQLNNGVGVRYVGINGGGGGVHLLHKVDTRRLGHTQPGRSGDDHAHLLSGEHSGDGAQGFGGPLPGLGVMPLVGTKQQFILSIQHHNLDGSGADVNANAKAHADPPNLS